MAEKQGGFSEEERAAMKQRAVELRATKGLKGAAKKARELEACLAVIDSLTGFDQKIAHKLHMIVSEEAPHLDPKTMYGFPAYALDGKNVVFLQQASKFKTRYATINFDEAATLDEGDMWATSFAVVALTPEVETKIRELVRRAVGR